MLTDSASNKSSIRSKSSPKPRLANIMVRIVLVWSKAASLTRSTVRRVAVWSTLRVSQRER